MEWCRDRVSYVTTKFWPRPKGLLSQHNVFMLRQSWPGQEFSFATECFYVATELGMVKRLYVATEYFISRQSVAKWRGFVL